VSSSRYIQIGANFAHLKDKNTTQQLNFVSVNENHKAELNGNSFDKSHSIGLVDHKKNNTLLNKSMVNLLGDSIEN
jgi:hypothetical protein